MLLVCTLGVELLLFVGKLGDPLLVALLAELPFTNVFAVVLREVRFSAAAAAAAFGKCCCCCESSHKYAAVGLKSVFSGVAALLPLVAEFAKCDCECTPGGGLLLPNLARQTKRLPISANCNQKRTPLSSLLIALHSGSDTARKYK